MLPGFRGSLVSSAFAQSLVGSPARRDEAGRRTAPQATIAGAAPERARRELGRWWILVTRTLGPASSVRALVDRGALPLITQLGFTPIRASLDIQADLACGVLQAGGRGLVGLLVAPWAAPLGAFWRDAVHQGIRTNTRWCVCYNGCQLRVVDGERTYARRFLEIDLAVAIDDDRLFALVWRLLHAETFATGTLCAFDRIVDLSDRHTSAVCASLQRGVHDAVIEILQGLALPAPAARRRGHLPAPRLAAAFEQSLTLVYRILFLLFAEARGLVPVWHPTYRRSYTIEALRDELDGPGRVPRAVWETLQAIWRLAHRGCRAGDLRVTPFNGRLFAPSGAPLAGRATLDDRAMGRALVALTTSRGGDAPERIAYSDLGVEQLGTVYEGVLDYRPVVDTAQGAAERPSRPAAIRLQPGSGARKATGTFYTPRSITDYLVRRTLNPLVAQASAERIVSLRVLDPAMGSGAFLVSACRYLASAYEAALIREGALAPDDIHDEDRAAFRRIVAQRCLFGVDLNPMAVQLARLSIWLATLAADRPLTFLDHRLAVGDSLIGASLDDLARQAPGRPRGRSPRAIDAQPSLFDAADLHQMLRAILPSRDRLARDPDDTLAVVREKEALLARLAAPGSSLARWKAAADLWCACWFWTADRQAPDRALFGDLLDFLLHDRGTLPEPAAQGVCATSRAIARDRRFFHWTLEFPEVFFDANGQPDPDAGFDAIVGNPPWDMLRADSGSADERRDAKTSTADLLGFARTSGIYAWQSDGHANRYQLFVERAVHLAKHGGRVGLVVPFGLAIDHGCAKLRRLLLERCDTDALVGFENRDGIFPIHRSVRFLLLTATRGGATGRVHCRFGERDPSVLDRMPDGPGAAGVFPIALTRPLLDRLSGASLAIPDLRSRLDLDIAAGAAARCPRLADPAGWGARFGRELNASDDRPHFVAPGRGLPVVEGKQIEPFGADAAAARFSILRDTAATLVDPAATFDRARLAYRDVASATNRLTLIAAVVPAGVITTHTLFCLKTPADREAQWVLCAFLNSFVANYLVRQRVSTHVTTAIVEALPCPRPARDSVVWGELLRLSHRLSQGAADRDDSYARLQALTARAYELSEEEYRHLLGTFPLIEKPTKDACLQEFVALRGG